MIWQDRVTPELIVLPEKDQMIVIGTNELGIHGAGAALAARKWGARLGQGFGPMANTFGIPTKDFDMQPLELQHIKFYVDRFLFFTTLSRYSKWKYLVTPIGTGLAGYDPSDIAPFFKGAVLNKRIYLPESFWSILTKK